MSLVAYSDSETSSSGSSTERNIISNPHTAKGLERKRKRGPDYGEQQSHLPPLPDSFHDLYSSTARASNHDDPSLHAGRQRQIPHVEGQWPTHVYLEWHPSKPETDVLTRALKDAEKTLPPVVQLHNLLKSELGADLPLHISLSRTLMLATHQRQLFTETLRISVQEIGVKPFTIRLGNWHWVANYERNRWFLVVRAKKPPGDQLNKLLRASNQAAQNLNQPCLYVPQDSPAVPVTKNRRLSSTNKQEGSEVRSVDFEEHMVKKSSSHGHEDMSDRFHISIGWTLQNPEEKSGEVEGDSGTQSLTEIDIPIETVKVKIGNGLVVLPLTCKTGETNGIVGL